MTARVLCGAGRSGPTVLLERWNMPNESPTEAGVVVGFNRSTWQTHHYGNASVEIMELFTAQEDNIQTAYRGQIEKCPGYFQRSK